MRIAIAVLTAALASRLVAAPKSAAPVADNSSPRARAEQLLATGHADTAEAPAREWLAAAPDDPEAYVLLANVLMGEAMPAMVVNLPDSEAATKNYTVTKTESGELQLTDPDTGAVKGSLGAPSAVPDDEAMKAHAKQAIEILGQATQKFPNRLDIWFGLAHSQQLVGDYPGQIATLRGAVARVHDHSKDIRWEGGSKLDEPPGDFMERGLASYWEDLSELDLADPSAVLGAYARFYVEVSPKSSSAWNNLAVLDTMREDWTAARANFEKALSFSPRDGVIMMNLAHCSWQLGEPAAEKAWLERIVKSSGDAEAVAHAKQRLETIRAGK